MRTDRLIEQLARDVPPVPRRAVGWRLALGIVGGGMVTIGAIALLLGFRPDLDLAMQGPNFWIKWAYTISLGLLSIHATARLARPVGRLPALWPPAALRL